MATYKVTVEAFTWRIFSLKSVQTVILYEAKSMTEAKSMANKDIKKANKDDTVRLFTPRIIMLIKDIEKVE